MSDITHARVRARLGLAVPSRARPGVIPPSGPRHRRAGQRAGPPARTRTTRLVGLAAFLWWKVLLWRLGRRLGYRLVIAWLSLGYRL